MGERTGMGGEEQRQTVHRILLSLSQVNIKVKLKDAMLGCQI